MRSLEKQIEIPSFPLEMYNVPGYDKANIEKYFKNKDQDRFIKYAVEKKDIGDLIKQAFEKDVEMQVEAAKMIWRAPKEERAELIKLAFEKDVAVQIEAAAMILFALEEERAELIKLAFEKDVAVQVGAAAVIPHLSNLETKTELRLLISEKIKHDFENYISTQAKAMKNLICISEENRTSLIKQALEKDIEMQVEAAKMICTAPKKERTELIRLAFEKDVAVQAEAAKMIWSVPEEDKLNLFKQSFEKDIAVQITAIKSIDVSNQKEDRVEFELFIFEKIKQAFEKNVDIPVETVKMIRYAPEEKKSELIKLAFEKGLGDKVIANPLYNKYPQINTDILSRKKFEKTGSNTTLLGGNLKDKLIIRHIEPEAFILWQKTYENYQIWEKLGFNYVPIEPIQSYNFDSKKVLVNVYSGVLDLNLYEWEKISGGIFQKELTEQKEMIENALTKEGIAHGHPHEQNFCLRFFRDKNGKPDITKTPRLYLIDFDMASSLNK